MGLLTETHEYYFGSLKHHIFIYSRWRNPPKTISPRPYCRSRRGRNGLGSETTLAPEDKAIIKKKLETARQTQRRFQTTPTLPKFSGTDAGREEVDFETWKYMLTSLVEEQGYSEAALETAIRKSLIGEAAQHLRNSGAADVANITRILELDYGGVLCEITTWQDFYSAKQRLLESATSWRIRLEEIICRIEGQEDGGRNSKLRTQWWTQLYSKTLKTATRHKYDDVDVELNDLVFLCKED